MATTRMLLGAAAVALTTAAALSACAAPGPAASPTVSATASVSSVTVHGRTLLISPASGGGNQAALGGELREDARHCMTVHGQVLVVPSTSRLLADGGIRLEGTTLRPGTTVFLGGSGIPADAVPKGLPCTGPDVRYFVVGDYPQPQPTGATICAASALSVAATAMTGFLETERGSIDITNHGTASCTLHGWPRASLMDGAGGARIGALAHRTGPTDDEVPAVTLRAHGGRATLRVAIAGIGGYSDGSGGYSERCGRAVRATGWSILLPGTDSAFFVPLVPTARFVCSSRTLSTTDVSQVLPPTRTP